VPMIARMVARSTPMPYTIEKVLGCVAFIVSWREYTFVDCCNHICELFPLSLRVGIRHTRVTYRHHSAPRNISMVCQCIKTWAGASLITVLKIRGLECMFAGN
jgi:hypothetical protein